MITADRISFEEAVTEPSLLKARFDTLSVGQQSLLKIFYGMALSPGRVDEKSGLSELDYWAAFQGYAEYDVLGYPLSIKGIPPYIPKEYREAWGIIGRRGSKTDAFASTITAYESTLGGHERFLRPSQIGLCFQIAQDLRMARYSLKFVQGALESSPLLSKGIRQVTADRIDLKNNMTITCVPPTLKSVRGYANAVGVLDEVGVWYQSSDSANPDLEIYRALSPGQMQFPDRKIIGISTPFNKAGILYRMWEAGTDGCKLPPDATNEYGGMLVAHGTTALMGNPFVTRSYLQVERDRDLYAFQRECLALFQDSISGFLPAPVVDAAIDRAISSRPAQATYTYVGVIDPAFRRDAFAFTIMHRDETGKVVQDIAERFVPVPGESLKPREILSTIALIARRYSVSVLYSDQYQLEALRELAQEFGLLIVGVSFTAKSKSELYGNLQQMFVQGIIRLLDDPETVRELKSLERTITDTSTVSIKAPPGGYDDMATVVCIAASEARKFSPATVQPDFDVMKEPTPYQRVVEQIEQRSRTITFYD